MELNQDLKKLLDLSISLTAEKDYNRLLEGIITDAMDISRADGGTLYISVPEGLKFMIMRTKSLDIYRGGAGEEIDLPVVEMTQSNVCAYCAINRKIVNIDDVYDSDLFDFTGPRRYDSMTGYRTCSMMVLPLLSHEDELLGVLQLINATDDEGRVVPFDPAIEYIIYSIASQASVSLANLIHMREIKSLMDSVIRSFAKAIDERTPYNANHTDNVTRYCKGFVKYINKRPDLECYHLDERDSEQLLMAARLHDVGKLIVPLEIMNKSARLTPEEKLRIDNRFERISLLIELHHAKGETDREEYEEQLKALEAAIETVNNADTIGFVSDELLEDIRAVAALKYRDIEGDEHFYLNDYELGQLSIRKGTLSAKEREIMESHVVSTRNILAEIHFGNRYNKVLGTAASHHEFLDGSGYPDKLKGDEIPMEVRIITIADIYDSLCAADRPYKKALPPEKARGILRAMVKEGKLDPTLVELFCEYTELMMI